MDETPPPAVAPPPTASSRPVEHVAVFYRDGKYRNRLRKECFYLGGRRHGSFRRYYPDGQVSVEATYKRDRLEGSYREYFPGGGLALEAYYRDGSLDGSYRKFAEDGTLLLDCTFGEERTCSCYDEAGEVSARLVFP